MSLRYFPGRDGAYINFRDVKLDGDVEVIRDQWKMTLKKGAWNFPIEFASEEIAAKAEIAFKETIREIKEKHNR